jgi:hypothetical protein
MLLTDTVIDDLHQFRTNMMRRLVAALKILRPSAEGLETGAGYASYPGDGPNLCQVYGISHRGAEFDLDAIEEFYRGKAENWELIVTPFESQALMAKAVAMGYVPDHFESVLALTAPKPSATKSAEIEVEEITGDMYLWSQVSDAAWNGRDELQEELSWIGRMVSESPTRRFLGRLNGEPAATASLVEVDGRFMFAGASTLPKFRNRGLQTALTNHRLAIAGEGSFVQVVAVAGSQSHRNLQRIGFSPLYSKLVMFRRDQSNAESTGP